jgi:glycine dehydrogenase subunit 1
MLAAIRAGSLEELYEEIPESLRFRGDLGLPPALVSEQELKAHVEGLLRRNTSCEEATSFLGGGCYNHYVPAVCTEIAGRSEFLTAYAGEPYEDFGRFQVLWEYQSLMAELLDMDICNVPTYDGHQAACTALSMAARYTGRRKLLVAGSMNPDRLRAVRNYCEPVLEVQVLDFDPGTGQLEPETLDAALDATVAAVYLEYPNYFGVLEGACAALAEHAHRAGALLVAGTDPSALGVLASPAAFGADLLCGEIQALGNPMHFGGGLGGFIASRDEEKLVLEYPSRLFGITSTSVPGERAFGDVAYDRTSFAHREKGKEFVGTAAALHGISAAVYLALMGPQGMRDLGAHLLQKAQYLALRLGAVPGVRAPALSGPHFKEFVVDFRGTGQSVATLNAALLAEGIFGGHDLGQAFPALAGHALWCVTELVTMEEIDRTCQVLQHSIGGGH